MFGCFADEGEAIMRFDILTEHINPSNKLKQHEAHMTFAIIPNI